MLMKSGMENNDVLRSIRYLLNINDQKIVHIAELADLNIPLSEVQEFLKKEDEPGFQPCDDQFMSYFLDGLIYLNRGRDENRPQPALELPFTNNTILKKLRVAFQLKEQDMLELIEKGGYRIGRSELSAFLRKKDHANYRDCGDQVLRYFLKGLTLKFRG